MKVVRIARPDAIRPLHAVQFCLIVIVLTGSLLLLSAAKPTAPVDGAIEWHEESWLRAVVQLLCLNYDAPTIYAGAIKNYILGVGAGLTLLALCIAIAVGSVTGSEETAETRSTPSSDAPPESAIPKGHVAPLIAAQVLGALYVLWSFGSSRWSWAPELAVGASILLSIQFLWAFGIGNGLKPRAACSGSRAVVVVGAAAAAMAIWYHYGRNPTLRADFPVGNPAFLAACLIPAVLLGVGVICEKAAAKTRGSRLFLPAVAAAIAVVLCVWASVLADSRGPYVGLAFGALGMIFFAVRGRWKFVPVVLAAGVLVCGWMYYGRIADAASPTGRNATLRLRSYAWSYAWQMFNEKPFTGHGQGAFVLKGDTYVVNDVLDDPLVFESRIAHAHNEWLEIMADLGSVGIVLITATLLLTLQAGTAALAASPPSAQRWALLGCMGALVGLIVEETFGVGLRVAGVATMFYTVIGLIWALSGYGTAGLTHHLSRNRAFRIGAGAIGGVVGVAALATAQQDFGAARNSYRAEQALQDGSHDTAIALARLATDRLNPQRALTGLYRLAAAHLRAAEYRHALASDRERRAREAEYPDARLLALAQQDYALSDVHCEDGAKALKELLLRSPGFINHGRLAFQLNLIRARNAAARQDFERQQSLVTNAAAALERELRRQPFNPAIAIDYLSVAGSTLTFPEIIEVYARPLRHHRVSEPYLRFLQPLAAAPEFDKRFEPLRKEAEEALAKGKVDEETGVEVEIWAPEKLRVIAAVLFLRGEYRDAQAVLEIAAPAYDSLADAAPFGAASCYGELAVCRFFSDPSTPDSALASAARAIELAPESRLGRELKHSIKLQMSEFLVAADREQDALRLLRETAPKGATEEAVLAALGLRYRNVCESLLGRREAGGILRKPPAQLTPKLRRWAARAIELNPLDPAVHYLAADLAFHVGEADATAEHLRQAVRYGLPPDVAVEFLRAALNGKPDSPALQALWAELVPTDPTPTPTPPPRQAPEPVEPNGTDSPPSPTDSDG